MVIMRLEDLALEEGVEHIATDWQISNREDFANIVLQAKKDDVNKTSIVFSETLDPTRKWYGRARCLLTTGYTVWGNLEIFTTDQNDTLESLSDLPSRISVPQVTTTSDKDNHDVTLFDIQATGFEVVGNSTHYATSWIIEDIDGNVQWSSLENSIYKEFISVHDIILNSNAVYRLKVIFHSSSGDLSPIATYSIRTGDSSDVHLLTYIDDVDPAEPLNLKMNQLENVSEVTWKIYGFVNDIAYKMWEETISDNNYMSVTVPVNTLNKDEIYLLEITPTSDEVRSKFIPFRTKSTSSGTVTTNPTVTFKPSVNSISMKRDTEQTITYETDADDVSVILGNSLAATLTLNKEEKTLVIKTFDNQLDLETKIIITATKEGYETYTGEIPVFISDLDKIDFQPSVDVIELSKDVRESTFTVSVPEGCTISMMNTESNQLATIEQVTDQENTWKVIGNQFNRKGKSEITIVGRQQGYATTVKTIVLNVPNSLYKYSCANCGWSHDGSLWCQTIITLPTKTYDGWLNSWCYNCSTQLITNHVSQGIKFTPYTRYTCNGLNGNRESYYYYYNNAPANYE